MSPILVRPVREQLEHDRLIRLLQAKNRRKYDAGINPGAQQNVPVTNGVTSLYPDVVLTSLDRRHKVEVVIEVETGESVNHLEALAQWAHLARLRPAFHLYVPSSMVDVARQLCHDNNIVVGEIWSFHGIGDDLHFTLVQRSREVAAQRRRPAPGAAAPVPRTVGAATAAKPASLKKAAAKPAPAKSTPAGKLARPAKAVRLVKAVVRQKVVKVVKKVVKKVAKKVVKKPGKAQKRK